MTFSGLTSMRLRGLGITGFEALRHNAAYQDVPVVQDLTEVRARVGAQALHEFSLRGAPMPDVTQLGDIINRAVERMSPADRASGRVSPDALSIISSEVTRASGTERPINITSADAARIEQLGPHRHNFGAAGDMLLAAAAAAARGGPDAAARGGPLSSLPQHFTQEMRAAQTLANTYGMPWAASDQSLLRLGPQAIQALKDAEVREEVFKKARAAGISASTAVAIAKRAKAAGRDANEAIGAATDAVNAAADAARAAGRPPAEVERVRREMDGTLTGYLRELERPEVIADPARRTEAFRKLEEHWRAQAPTPEAREKIDRSLEIIRGHTATVTANVARADVAAAAAQTITNNLADIYGSSGPAPADPTTRADASVPAPNNGQVVAGGAAPAPTNGQVVAAPAPTTAGVTQVAAVRPQGSAPKV